MAEIALATPLAPRRLEIEHDRLIERDRNAPGPYHFAVIDIGSNSVRLLVYDDLSRAPFPRFNEKSLCGLGAGLDADGRLSAKSMDCTVRAVARFCAIARAMNVDRIDVFATEAARRAANGDELTDTILRRSGLHVHVLSGVEEATYSALGVISGFHKPKGVAGDMGGGSLELAELAGDDAVHRTVSLPLGALPVTAMLAKGMSEAKQRVDDILRQQLPAMTADPSFYTVGGSWRALARVHIAMKSPPIGIVHGYEIEAQEARGFVKDILHMSPEELSKLPGLPSRRESTLPAAALTLDRVLKATKAQRVVFSALGLREGWLYAQLSPEDRERDPLIDGAQSLAMTTARVPSFGAALVRWTDGLFAGETPAERRLRVAACVLSDIAWRDHPDTRATESFRRLLTFPFVGIGRPDRVFVAAAVHARYRGKADDPVMQPVTGLMDEALRRRACVLGRALSLGYRLSGSVPDILDGARLTVSSDRVRLHVADLESIPDSDAVRARLRQFAKAAGIPRAEVRVGNLPDVESVEA